MPPPPVAVTLASMSEFNDEDAAFLRRKPEADWSQQERAMLWSYEAKEAAAKNPRPRRRAQKAPSIVSSGSRAIARLRHEGLVSQLSSLAGGQPGTVTSVVLAQGPGPSQLPAMQRTESYWNRVDDYGEFPGP